MNLRDLVVAVTSLPDDVVEKMGDLEVRIGDVAEGDDLHCSVGKAVYRNGCIVLVPGDDDVWKDETLASEILSVQFWPEEEPSED